MNRQRWWRSHSCNINVRYKISYINFYLSPFFLRIKLNIIIIIIIIITKPDLIKWNNALQIFYCNSNRSIGGCQLKPWRPITSSKHFNQLKPTNQPAPNSCQQSAAELEEVPRPRSTNCIPEGQAMMMTMVMLTTTMATTTKPKLVMVMTTTLMQKRAYLISLLDEHRVGPDAPQHAPALQYRDVLPQRKLINYANECN